MNRNWIRFRFHPLFSIILLLSIVTGYVKEIIVLFGIVLIHELGHVTAAKAFGWRVREIQLLPFGGVAVMEELGTVSAWEELVVALAGPLQNVWMIGLGLFMKSVGWFDAHWWDYFISANAIIAAFNMLPVLPLDGGKVVQVVLSYMLPYHRVIMWSTSLSIAISAALIILAIIPAARHGLQLNLLAVAVFLFASNCYALKQKPYHFLRFLMSRDRVFVSCLASGQLAQPIVVQGREKISDILRLFMRERYHLIYVMNEHGSIHAVLPEQRLLDTFFIDKRPGCAVSELFL